MRSGTALSCQHAATEARCYGISSVYEKLVTLTP